MTHSGGTGRRRVVITGLGLVSPLGNDPQVFWSKLLSGCSGVDRIQRFDVSAYPTQIGAEVRDFQSSDPELEMEQLDSERIGRYALSASYSALQDSGLSTDNGTSGSRFGVVLAGGPGTYEHKEFFSSCSAAITPRGDFDWAPFVRQFRFSLEVRAAERRSPGNIAARIADRFDFRGPVMATMTACAAGTQALGNATRWIQRGDCDVVLAGGADSELYPMGLASFCLLQALSTRNADPAGASRPFDARRDGFVIGEGSGMLVLEEMDHARLRGARIYAEVAGFGSACDSYRVTAPHPRGRGAVIAMNKALSDGGVSPEQIGYINAHGTSTHLNDRTETIAIRTVFGKHAYRVATSSTKSMIGHLTVAAGAVEAIVTALTLHFQCIHPTINHENRDPECDLDYVPKRPRQAAVEYALSNSFAFGGQCSCLLLQRSSD